MDRRSFLAERLIPDIIQSNQIHVDCSPPLAMDQANHQAARLRFGVFEADLGARELTKLGKLLPLQEQPFQLLAMLLEKPGVLVTREELRARLWPQTVVDFDHGLNKAISKIRDGLGDSAENPPLHSNRGAARLQLLGRRHEDRPRTGRDRAHPNRTAPLERVSAQAPILADSSRAQRLKSSADANIALIYVGLGDMDQAMSWLNKAYDARFNPSILIRPAFDPLRSDARFQELKRRMGLPP
jgi:tetratricopeptide (TPR) repeat protein